MFLHLGSDVSVLTKDIVAIMDYKLFEALGNAAYLTRMEEQNRLIFAFEERAANARRKERKRSLVMALDKCYISSFSANTLRKRAQMPWDEDDELEPKQ